MCDLELGASSPASTGGEVCVVDDDEGSRTTIAGLLESEGIPVRSYASAEEFLSEPRSRPPMCLVLDITMPGFSGLELQNKLAVDGSRVPIIFVTGHAEVPLSVRAIKAGAREYFTKPFDANELLEAIGGCALHQRAAASEDSSLSVIVGNSSSLREALRQVGTVARTESTVLVYGETGTGKELVARAIHAASPRRDGPFVKVNCAAIPRGLIESELMGHERGSFTGAIARRIGRFELAQDGTIFLDEIGEIPLDLQPKLLRLLQEREFERVGGATTIKTNARLVAATNRDLAAMARERTFREDLYYRLNVFPVELPPLRERVGDLPILVEHFVRDLSVRMGREIERVSAASMRRLAEHDWPGNVRELQNVLERAVILASGPTLEVTIPRTADRASTSMITVPSRQIPEPPTETALPSENLAAHSREHILRVLESTNWLIAGPSGAAAKLGLKRSTLHFRMKKLGISRRIAND